MICPLDNTVLRVSPELLQDNRFGLNRTIQIAWCGSCGLGVTLDPPSSDELERLYATCYTDDGIPQVPRTGLAAKIWHRVNGSLPLVDERFESPLLDVGCNTGEVLAVLRARGLEVVGIEPNPDAAAKARKKGIEVIVGPIETTTLAPGGFSSAILSQVLEHVHDPKAVLARVRSGLATDGTIYVVVPNSTSVWRKVFGSAWVHWHVPFHLWHHTPRSLALLLEGAGFEVTTMRTITPGEWLLMHLEARRNARRGVYTLLPFRGRFFARLVIAPIARLADVVGRGDALYAIARRRSDVLSGTR